MTAWDMTGGSLWLDREEWGVVVDALIQHRGHAEERKAANSESTSNVRADMCADLIRRIKEECTPGELRQAAAEQVGSEIATAEVAARVRRVLSMATPCTPEAACGDLDCKALLEVRRILEEKQPHG